jgi:hypothetical protein
MVGVCPQPEEAFCRGGGRFWHNPPLKGGRVNGASWSGAVGAGFRIVVGNGLAAYGKAWAIAAAPKTMVKRETSAATLTGWRLHKLNCDMIRA